jgi:hypothetical protein
MISQQNYCIVSKMEAPIANGDGMDEIFRRGRHRRIVIFIMKMMTMISGNMARNLAEK